MRISIIMQVYLGEYPGSRSNSDEKFLRAVQSFIDQTNKDSELIIVSDGCFITHELYYKYYKDNDRIKYIFVDKDTPNMYEGEQKYYRGLPRQIGRSIATGDVITYMDSDDFLLTHAFEYLKRIWLKNNNAMWLINQSWYDNQERKYNPLANEHIAYESSKDQSLIKIKGLDSMWYAVISKENAMPMQPWVLSHKNTCSTKWRDCYGLGFSEDVDFHTRLIEDYKVGYVYKYPFYVRCHYSKKWDY